MYFPEVFTQTFHFWHFPRRLPNPLRLLTDNAKGVATAAGTKGPSPSGPSPTGDSWNRLCSHSCMLPRARLLRGSPWPPALGGARATTGGSSLPLISSQAARSPCLRFGAQPSIPHVGGGPTLRCHAPRLLRPTQSQKATWDTVIRCSVRPTTQADAPKCA